MHSRTPTAAGFHGQCSVCTSHMGKKCYVRNRVGLLRWSRGSTLIKKFPTYDTHARSVPPPTRVLTIIASLQQQQQAKQVTRFTTHTAY